ncbi:MAG: DUF362 domain-containing protein [bacterium]
MKYERNSITISRRQFIKLVGYSSLILSQPIGGGCGSRPSQTKSDTTFFTVSLVKDTDESYAIDRAIELAGGLNFILPGDTILLKLALNSPYPFPATTSPFIVAHLIKRLKERGAGEIYVGDKSPRWQDTMSCMEETGIYQTTVNAGAYIAIFEDNEMIPVKPVAATHWPVGFSIPTLFTRVDHIIALPTLRTHVHANFTMGIKSFVGALPQSDRDKMHNSLHFFERIAEIPLCTDKIRLSLLDARSGFNSEGPDSGNLITPGIIIASKNLVASDIAGLALLKSFGTTSQLTSSDIWGHPTIKRAIEIYSPTLSIHTLNLVYEGIDNIEEIRNQLHNDTISL